MGFAELLAAVDRTARRQLGCPVVYTPGAGSPVTVNGIFDRTYVRDDLGTPGVATSGPAVFLTIADLTSNPITDAAATVTIAGLTYTCHEPQPDGMGGVILLLHLV